jgi:hypothetical protein
MNSCAADIFERFENDILNVAYINEEKEFKI